VGLTRAALALAQAKPAAARAWAEPVVAQLHAQDAARHAALAASAADALRVAAEAAELKANGVGADDDDDADDDPARKGDRGGDDGRGGEGATEAADAGEAMAAAMAASRAAAEAAGSRCTWLAVETLALAAAGEGSFDEAERLLRAASAGMDTATNWCEERPFGLVGLLKNNTEKKRRRELIHNDIGRKSQTLFIAVPHLFFENI
jgi:hypothetical protein